TLSWVRATSNEAPAAVAWQPWSVEHYCFCATRTSNPDLKVQFARRDFVLANRWFWLVNLVDYLVAAGKRDEARALAATAHARGVRIILAASEARFGAALDHAHQTLPTADDPMHAMYAAGNATTVAGIVERPVPELAGALDRVLGAKPSPADRDVILDFQ